ncbi:hypothetical protein FEM48_Zijuj05G0080700 [Ziziphus jujuba var. spinosa]|uniref:Protein NUCLEAR FUSION DEFECTIVE 4-like n=1 Tax=Ziziphus jujuba var. spinosa TaxID=714518 RepID=A0A978VDS9_ZIZJJ|nr:hypothetical protein FEM48_Zijuj05G0080700 [Ziziphus jujuba var. spinosa]
MEILSNKWVAMVASIWIQCIGGSSYTFSIYSSALKSSQGYDQSTLDTVSVFKDIGANVGVLSGLLYTAVTHRGGRFWGTQLAGPWVVHLAGAVQCFVGYFFMWAAVTGLIHRPPVPLMCFFMLLAAHAQTFFNTANIVTGVHNFSYYSGTIVGILKGFLGLSGAILVEVYDVVCEGQPSAFLLVLALLPTIVSLAIMGLVRIYETNSMGDDKKHLNAVSAIALIIVGYQMVIIILNNIFTFPSWASISTFIPLLLLLASPLGIAIKAEIEESKRVPETIAAESNSLLEDTSDKISAAEYPSEYEELPSGDHEIQVKVSSDDEMLAKEEDLTVLQAMSTLNFWLLFIAMVCGMGSGLATINNMSQLGQSLGYKTVEISSFVSLWSIWNFLGRFGAGYLSDVLLHARGWPRPLLMAITLATMSAGHIIIGSGFSGNLYIGSFLVGICYGSQWSLMPTITSEIFGLGDMATIFNTIAIASPVGSYIFSVRVIGCIYDKEAAKEGGNSCLGTHCFMLSFMIMAFVAFFGFLVAMTLLFRTRRFYQLVVIRRLERPLRQ